MSLDRTQLIDAFTGDDSAIQARAAGLSVIFTLPGTSDGPDRQVWWNVSDATLASLVTKLSPGARAAYGLGGDGFAVLISRLDEELEPSAETAGNSSSSTVATSPSSPGDVILPGQRSSTAASGLVRTNAEPL